LCQYSCLSGFHRRQQDGLPSRFQRRQLLRLGGISLPQPRVPILSDLFTFTFSFICRYGSGFSFPLLRANLRGALQLIDKVSTDGLKQNDIVSNMTTYGT
jgi:hypothetical protein